MVDDKAQKEAAKDKSQMLLSDFISMLMEEYKQRGQPAYLRLRAARIKLEKFRPGARLCDIDKKFCVDYAEWLQSEPLTPQGKPLAQATAFSSFWNLGITLSSARQKGYIKSNPWELLGSMRFHFHNFYRTLSIKKLHRDGLYKVVFVKFFTRACAGRVYLLE